MCISIRYKIYEILYIVWLQLVMYLDDLVWTLFHADSVGYCLERRGEVITFSPRIVYMKKRRHALKLLYKYNIVMTLRARAANFWVMLTPNGFACGRVVCFRLLVLNGHLYLSRRLVKVCIFGSTSLGYVCLIAIGLRARNQLIVLRSIVITRRRRRNVSRWLLVTYTLNSVISTAIMSHTL